MFPACMDPDPDPNPNPVDVVVDVAVAVAFILSPSGSRGVAAILARWGAMVASISGR